ncbi:hypothetical protein EXIGLDRAFT_716511 [Exidia glandulosa HHB12029]|uniref:F-box domain-containing protein n=1 Tax=Exidia glandulosa HHB12029 TaxID=1314781 RepID=A0A165P9Z4_EXIGL|nr:hypothetical protein EXIGLDRAFT_716511 [Exidia glandulosa HHB12029]
MDPNRYAEPHDHEALRAAISAARESLERQLDDARQNLDAADAKLEAEARVPEAEYTFWVALQAYSEAIDAFEDAQRRIHEDPGVLRMLGLLHPIRRLPAELLGYIFVLTVHEHLAAVPARARAPFRIAAVCRRWRDVSLHTPSVWRQIHTAVSCSAPYDQAYPFWLQLAAQRSGHRDIVLTLTLTYNYNIESASSVANILRALLARNAVNSFSITCRQGVAEVDWGSFGFGSHVGCASLISLHLIDCHHALVAVQSLPVTTPNLQTITASCTHFERPLPVPHLHVAHAKITQSLDIRGVAAMLIISNAFRAYPNVKTMFIDLPPPPRHSAGILEHNALDSLRLRATGGFPVLCDGFWLPSLRHLTLEVHSGWPPRDSSGPLHLLSSSLSGLRTLDYDADVSLSTLIPALRILPRLESLVCAMGVVDEAFLAAFLAGDGDYLCPRLGELHVGRLSDVQLAPRFVAVVAARIEMHSAGARIAKLRDVSCDCIPPYSFQLRELFVPSSLST